MMIFSLLSMFWNWIQIVLFFTISVKLYETTKWNVCRALIYNSNYHNIFFKQSLLNSSGLLLFLRGLQNFSNFTITGLRLTIIHHQLMLCPQGVLDNCLTNVEISSCIKNLNIVFTEKNQRKNILLQKGCS